MLATGSPQWSLVALGAATIPLGLFVWHRLGSLGEFLNRPSSVTRQLARTTATVLLVVIAIELLLLSR